ncbi:MAG TPA: hypothetical protein VKB89_02820 [Xanthobacteraceae bacterium]|nr:hypothetical protein [Xanthobacteraceae bacterium]
MSATTSGISAVPAETGSDEGAPQGQSHVAGPEGSPPKPPPSAEQHKQIDYNLVRPSLEDWEGQDPQTVAQYYAQTESDFFSIVDSYRQLANEAVANYRDAARSHGRWRFWMIIAGGILTLINVLAAVQLLKETGPQWIPTLLSAVAAVYAACLTVAGNVEYFYNWSDRAAGFRESRELLLNQFREYSSKWVYYVEAYGKTPKACANAGQLYRELVDSDQDLRQKLKELTLVQERGKPSNGGQK